MAELGRLAPTVGKDGEPGAEKDYSRLKKTDIARVLKAATKSAGDKLPSVRDIRKAVDDDLGIDRATQAAETKKRREHDRQIDLPDFLRQETGKLEATINILAKVPAEGWEQLAESHPGLAERLAAVCDELAEFLRS